MSKLSNVAIASAVPSGQISLKTFLRSLFLCLSNVAVIVRSSEPRSVSGYASIVATTGPDVRRSLTFPAAFKMSGPESPKCVKRILPVSEKAFFRVTVPSVFSISREKVIFIKLSDVPASIFTQASSTSSGTIVGVGFLTVCPRSRSQAKPSPVEPVSGCDTPPVARIKALARNMPWLVSTATICIFPAPSATADFFSMFTAPPSVMIFFTGQFSLTNTPVSLRNFSMTRSTSAAFSVRGKARLRACTTSGSLSAAKKSNVLCTPNCANGEYRKSAAGP